MAGTSITRDVVRLCGCRATSESPAAGVDGVDEIHLSRYTVRGRWKGGGGRWESGVIHIKSKSQSEGVGAGHHDVFTYPQTKKKLMYISNEMTKVPMHIQWIFSSDECFWGVPG